MQALLTESALLRGITLTFGLAHFAISGAARPPAQRAAARLAKRPHRERARAPFRLCPVAGSDSLVELYCSDQFGWEALQWGAYSMVRLA